MSTIQFFVEGAPKGQPRPRAFVRNGRAAVYDGSSAESWKSQIAVAGREHRPEVPLDGPVSLVLTFYFPRPKNHYGTGKKATTLKDSAPEYHTGKPDADNLAKAVMDAMTQLQFWRDDGQVCELTIVKLFCGEGGRPGCRIKLNY